MKYVDEYLELLPGKSVRIFDYCMPSVGKKKILVFGIGGGSDIVGAYSIASMLQKKNSESEIVYGLCVSQKHDYEGFERINDGLFKRSPFLSDMDLENHHSSLKLTIEMNQFDENLPAPYLIVRPKMNSDKILKVFQESLKYIEPDIVYAVDLGGDSLTCGIEDESGFDRTGLKALKDTGIPFIHLVLGLGCDGESKMDSMMNAIEKMKEKELFFGAFNLSQEIDLMTPISTLLLDKYRTPNIMVSANEDIVNNPDKSTETIIIPRHINPEIPLRWLVTGIAMDGKSRKG